MKQSARPDILRRHLGGRRGAIDSILRLTFAIGGAILVAYLFWPYATLWQLNTALTSADTNGLADLVDVDSVRHEIKRKLNKDSDSRIDILSDPFIRWLEGGIQSRGSAAVDQLVTLEWVRERLLVQGPPATDAGFLGQIIHAFFDAPTAFRLSVGRETAHPVQVLMRLDGFSWKIKAVYY